MPLSVRNRPHRTWPVLAIVLLAAGCTTVDLGPRYAPPPIQMPQPLPSEPAPTPVAPVVQAQPVAPVQPIEQPLPPVESTAPDANLVTLTARLDGASVIPPAHSAANGQLDAVYDRSTRLLRWKTNWVALSGNVTAVEFHGPAEAGQNGPPTMIWPSPFGTHYEGRATLPPQQAADLLAGRWYVIVVTGAYPMGELRGQLRVIR